MWSMPDTRMPSRFHRKWLIASVLCTIFVLMLTHIPNDALPRILQKNLLDKVEHVLAYGAIATLFVLSVPNTSSLGFLVIGLAVLAGIGILDETTQPLVNRYASLGDYGADLVGIVLAGLIFLVKRRLTADTTAPLHPGCGCGGSMGSESHG